VITLANARYCTPTELAFLRELKSRAFDPCARPIALRGKDAYLFDFDWELPMHDLMAVLQAHADGRLMAKML
jgi:hypothetical protein